MDYNTPGARESLTRKDAFGERLDRGQINHIVTYKGKTYLGDEGNEVRIVAGRIELV